MAKVDFGIPVALKKGNSSYTRRFSISLVLFQCDEVLCQKQPLQPLPSVLPKEVKERKGVLACILISRRRALLQSLKIVNATNDCRSLQRIDLCWSNTTVVWEISSALQHYTRIQGSIHERMQFVEVMELQLGSKKQ